jgi:hypothetical protein
MDRCRTLGAAPDTKAGVTPAERLLGFAAVSARDVLTQQSRRCSAYSREAIAPQRSAARSQAGDSDSPRQLWVALSRFVRCRRLDVVVDLQGDCR